MIKYDNMQGVLFKITKLTATSGITECSRLLGIFASNSAFQLCIFFQKSIDAVLGEAPCIYVFLLMLICFCLLNNFTN